MTTTTEPAKPFTEDKTVDAKIEREELPPLTTELSDEQLADAEKLVRRVCTDETEMVLEMLGITKPPEPEPAPMELEVKEIRVNGFTDGEVCKMVAMRLSAATYREIADEFNTQQPIVKFLINQWIVAKIAGTDDV